MDHEKSFIVPSFGKVEALVLGWLHRLAAGSSQRRHEVCNTACQTCYLGEEPGTPLLIKQANEIPKWCWGEAQRAPRTAMQSTCPGCEVAYCRRQSLTCLLVSEEWWLRTQGDTNINWQQSGCVMDRACLISVLCWSPYPSHRGTSPSLIHWCHYLPITFSWDNWPKPLSYYTNPATAGWLPSAYHLSMIYRECDFFHLPTWSPVTFPMVTNSGSEKGSPMRWFYKTKKPFVPQAGKETLQCIWPHSRPGLEQTTQPY